MTATKTLITVFSLFVLTLLSSNVFANNGKSNTINEYNKNFTENFNNNTIFANNNATDNDPVFTTRNGSIIWTDNL